MRTTSRTLILRIRLASRRKEILVPRMVALRGLHWLVACDSVPPSTLLLLFNISPVIQPQGPKLTNFGVVMPVFRSNTTKQRIPPPEHISHSYMPVGCRIKTHRGLPRIHTRICPSLQVYRMSCRSRRCCWQRRGSRDNKRAVRRRTTALHTPALPPANPRTAAVRSTRTTPTPPTRDPPRAPVPRDRTRPP